MNDPLVSVGKLAETIGFAPDVLFRAAEGADRSYRPFETDPRREGRKPRRIDNPVGLLKVLQTRINRRLLSQIEWPSEVIGAVRGRSIQTGASKHVGQPEVVALDIRRFFESVRPPQVAAVWRRHFSTGRDTTWILTRLTTVDGHLPQGAPSSSALANAVLLPAIFEIRNVVVPRGLRFSVYVDDIAVSGSGARHTIDEIGRILSRYTLAMARKKVRVMPAFGRQQVTGIVVNKKLSNGRDRIRAVRGRAFRLRAALSTAGPSGSAEVGRLNGLIAHMTAVCPAQGEGARRVLLGGSETCSDGKPVDASDE